MMDQTNSYLDQSGYKAAVHLEKIFSRKEAIRISFGLGFGALLFLFVAVTFGQDFHRAQIFFGFFEILLGLAILFFIYYSFLDYLTSEEYGRNLTFFATSLLFDSVQASDLRSRDFFRILGKQDSFIWVLRRLGIAPEDFLSKIETLYAEGIGLPLKEVLMLAWQKAVAANHLHIRYPDLVIAIFELDEQFRNLMFDYHVNESDLQAVIYWQRRREKERAAQGRLITRLDPLNTKGIGKDWSGGFTINLDRVAEDLTAEEHYYFSPVHLFSRNKEVDILERMLVRGAGSGNAVLVGPPGVGRHRILQNLAHRINTGQTYGLLRYMRLLQIDSASVLSGTSSLTGVLDKVRELFGEAYAAKNVILVIMNIDAFFDPNPEAGRVNATEALLPFLKSDLRIIGLTTLGGYQKTIGKNPQLQQLISKLEVVEPTTHEVLLILQDEVAKIERRSGLFFTHAALAEIVKLAAKFIQNLPNPEKSLKVLEETAIYAATVAGSRVVLPEHVQKVITARTKIPVEKVAGEEKETLLNLEQILHERIVGQDEAISQIANAMRRARSGVSTDKKPIGSFLFLGPTGVGKTETTKALAAVYFGSEKNIIRFDMSEFQEVHSINRLIGDADSESGGLLTEAVISKPFSLILFDEIEKAHPKILDLFLQVFDEGRLTDAQGRAINFTSAIIIGTSNAGAELIREMRKAGRNLNEAREEILDTLQKQGSFRPEFLNRFDAIIIFQPLSEVELARVATILLEELNQRLLEKEVHIRVTPEMARAVARGGFSVEFGARPLRRFIQEHIENYIAQGLIAGSIQRGQEIDIPPELLENK